MGCFYQPVFGKHLSKQDVFSDHFCNCFSSRKSHVFGTHSKSFLAFYLVWARWKVWCFVTVVVKIDQRTLSISGTWMYVVLQHSICLYSLSSDYWTSGSLALVTMRSRDSPLKLPISCSWWSWTFPEMVSTHIIQYVSCRATITITI